MQVSMFLIGAVNPILIGQWRVQHEKRYDAAFHIYQPCSEYCLGRHIFLRHVRPESNFYKALNRLLCF